MCLGAGGATPLGCAEKSLEDFLLVPKAILGTVMWSESATPSLPSPNGV